LLVDEICQQCGRETVATNKNNKSVKVEQTFN